MLPVMSQDLLGSIHLDMSNR